MKIITPEEGAELTRLWEALPHAVAEALAAIGNPEHGMSSEAFRAADKKVGEIFARIREIQE